MTFNERFDAAIESGMPFRVKTKAEKELDFKNRKGYVLPDHIVFLIGSRSYNVTTQEVY
jgi:hypothetical protein